MAYAMYPSGRAFSTWTPWDPDDKNYCFVSRALIALASFKYLLTIPQYRAGSALIWRTCGEP